MGGFVFKQRGTDTKAPRASVPGLTVRHLQYIATRPGAVFNQECGFSLWGSLEPFAPPANIQSLEQAKQLVRAEAERGRTIYRAVISLGEPEAGERGYYDRAKWERLVNAQIGSIAKDLHIQAADFRWMASMHYAEGHPHVHLVYWDAGNEPRQEYIPKERFQAYAEGVRANLNRFEFGQEIQAAQAAQTEAAKQLRLELRAMCLECNPASGLNIKALYQDEARLDLLTDRLKGLVQDLPRFGSLKYAYLPEDYRARLDALIDEITAMPQCKMMLDSYLTATVQVSTLYGNGEETQAAQKQKAMEKLHRELGNEILSKIREIKAEIEQDAPRTPGEAIAFAKEAVKLIPPETYKELLSMLPKDRISWSAMGDLPGFQDAKKAALNKLLDDARVRIRLNAYADQLAQDPDVTESPGEDEKPEWSRESAAYRKAYAAFFRAADLELCSSLRNDAGYQEEQQRTQTVGTVCNVFSLLSRLASQQRASTSLSAQRLFSRDRSREARMDRAQQASQGDGWTPDV